jgi:hypothetical protein
MKRIVAFLGLSVIGILTLISCNWPDTNKMMVTVYESSSAIALVIRQKGVTAAHNVTFYKDNVMIDSGAGEAIIFEYDKLPKRDGRDFDIIKEDGSTFQYAYNRTSATITFNNGKSSVSVNPDGKPTSIGYKMEKIEGLVNYPK